MNTELSNNINLLEPMVSPEDVWVILYNRIFNYVRVMLVIVEVLVLLAFATRMVFDKVNNDLKGEINRKTTYLDQVSLQTNEQSYRNYITLFSDIRNLSEYQEINTKYIYNILNNTPSDLNLLSFSYDSGKFSLNFTSDSFYAINEYETALKSNANLQNVSVNLNKDTKQSALISFSVSFVYNSETNAE